MGKEAGRLRLGVVMTGTGAHAAASVGVMRELARRGIAPCCVCGMQGGAWPAALFAVGMDETDMEKALHQAAALGRKMIAPMWYERLLGERMPAGVRMNRLLSGQTEGHVLSLCPRAALFPCRMARNGQRIVFSTRAFMQESGATLAMQATLGFAARAAMTVVPFLSPLHMMGSPLIAESDTEFACRELQALGAQRVLVIDPVPSPRRTLDALDQAGAALRYAGKHGEQTGVLRVVMPEQAGALDFARLGMCCEAGKIAAARELDDLLGTMGIAGSRVLPFRRYRV